VGGTGSGTNDRATRQRTNSPHATPIRRRVRLSGALRARPDYFTYAGPAVPGPRTAFLRALLGACLLLAVFRLWSWVEVFTQRSLQLDFAAYYGAGEAVRLGLDPYRNPAGERPDLWDGSSTFVHSRFLYPPLAARLFVPLTGLSYRSAKALWSGLSLLALAVALLLAARLAGVRTREGLLAGIVAALVFFPLLTHLERGQVDLLTLLLLLAGVAALAREGRLAQYVGGGAFALAALLKLNVVLLAPFLLVRRRGRALLGFVAGGAALVALSTAVDGPGAVRRYAENELPRILAYGESGPPESRLPPVVLERLRAGVPEGRTRKDGVVYEPAAFSFPVNAALVRSKLAPSLPLPRNRRLAALVVLGLLLGLSSLIGARSAGAGPIEELAFWQMAMTAVLLTGPLSWVMNAVWLIPTLFVAVRVAEDLGSRPQAFSLATTVCGLLLLGLPDVLAPYLFEDRYVIGGLVVFAGLLASLRAGLTGGRSSA